MTPHVPNSALRQDQQIVEYIAPGSPHIERVAVAFAGHLLSMAGLRVGRVLPEGGDPMADWPPLLPNGESALCSFLNAGKDIRSRLPSEEAHLITNDKALAADWSQGTVVLVTGEAGSDRRHSELTVMATSGLLDIFGSVGREPLPLPGQQMAYSAGTAAFNAMLCELFSVMRGKSPGRSSVSILDTALWLNWKHYLAAYMELPASGIGRAEDWSTYRCRDGVIAMVFQDKDMAKLSELIGEPRLKSDEFSTLRKRRDNIEAFQEIVSAWAAHQRRDDIVRQAAEMGLPLGPVLDVTEVVADRQMLARGFVGPAASQAADGRLRIPVPAPASEARPHSTNASHGAIQP